MAVSSLGGLYRLTPGGAQPPLVAILQIAEDDELVVASRHPTPSWGVFRFIDHHPTHSAAGSKRALTLRSRYSPSFALTEFSEVRLSGSAKYTRSSLTLSACSQNRLPH